MEAQALGIFLNEACIEGGIVGNDDRISAPLEEFREHHLDWIGAHDHGIVDGGELGDTERNGHLRINENVHAIHYFVVSELYGTDLYDVVGFRTEACGLDIENNGLCVEILTLFVLNNGFLIINEISLTAVDKLKILVMSDLFKMEVGIREGLDHAVICDGHGLHTEGNGCVYVIRHVGNRVHIGHLCMEVKLHTLLRRVIGSCRPLHIMLQDTVDEAHLHLLVEGIEGNGALYHEACSWLDELVGLLHIIVFNEDLAGDGICVVCDIELHDILSCLCMNRIVYEENVSGDDDIAGARIDILERDCFAFEVFAVENLCVFRHLEGSLLTLVLTCLTTETAAGLRLLGSSGVLRGVPALRACTAHTCKICRHTCILLLKCGTLRIAVAACHIHSGNVSAGGIHEALGLSEIFSSSSGLIGITPELRRNIVPVKLRNSFTLLFLIEHVQVEFYGAAVLKKALHDMEKLLTCFLIEMGIGHGKLKGIIVMP